MSIHAPGARCRVVCAWVHVRCVGREGPPPARPCNESGAKRSTKNRISSEGRRASRTRSGGGKTGAQGEGGSEKGLSRRLLSRRDVSKHPPLVSDGEQTEASSHPCSNLTRGRATTKQVTTTAPTPIVKLQKVCRVRTGSKACFVDADATAFGKPFVPRLNPTPTTPLLWCS